ncbi:MAG: hypothetical protein K6F77_10670 [Lachnospiraceae bacterium]|nr:hypothetical protein [Lachnospiraceae bacterium]
MPKNYEFKELNIYDKLVESKNNNDVKTTVSLLIDAYRKYFTIRTNSSDVDEIQAADASFNSNIEKFINEIIPNKEVTDPENPNNLLDDNDLRYFKEIYTEISENYYETAVTLYNKKEHWKNELKSGKIKYTEHLVNDDKTINKIAHDIVLQFEVDANAILDITNRLADTVRTKSIKDDDYLKIIQTVRNEYYTKSDENILKDAKVENHKLNAFSLPTHILEAQSYITQYKYNLTDEQFHAISVNFQDRNPSTNTGYEIKDTMPAEGESIFKSIPNYVKKCYDLKTVEEFEALEEELYDTFQTHERFVQMGSHSVDAVKKLYENLSNAKPNEKTDSYEETLHYLERYTHLGKDYKYLDPDIMPDLIKPSSKISPADVENATKYIDQPSDDYGYEMSDLVKGIEDKNSEEYKSANKILKTSVDIYELNKIMKERSSELMKKGVNSALIEETTKTNNYLQSQKKKLGFISVNPKTGPYAKFFNNQLEKLSASLVSAAVYNESYENLFTAINKHCRLYNYKVVADKKNDPSAEFYNKKYNDSIKTINNLIAECKKFEKNFTNDRNIMNFDTDRVELLDNISKSIDNPKVAKYDDAVTKTHKAQTTLNDELWFTYLCTLSNELKNNGHIFKEEDRVNLGFSYHGFAPVSEEKQALAYARQIVDKNIKSSHNIVDIMKFIEHLGFLSVKSAVNSGKDYRTISEIMTGQPDADLKSRFLFNNGGGTIDQKGLSNLEAETKRVLRSKFTPSFLQNKVGLKNKELTMGSFIESLRLDINNYPQFDANATVENSFENTDAIIDFIVEEKFKAAKEAGINKELVKLSTNDLKLYNLCKDFTDSTIDEHRYDQINAWKEETGKTLSEELLKNMTVNKLTRTQAALNSKKKLGIDAETEFGHFYRNNLNQKDDYTKAVLLDSTKNEEIMKSIVTDKKSSKLAKAGKKKVPVDYKHYIELHTAGKAGVARNDLIENLAKCITAIGLRKRGDAFNVSSIHKNVPKVIEQYELDNYHDVDTLRAALRDEKTVNKFALDCFRKMYGVKTENLKSFIADMKTLKENMVDPKRHGDKYNVLYNAIKDASEIDPASLTPEELSYNLSAVNLRVYDAVKAYTTGKEKIFSSDERNACFANAIDALAIVKKYAPETRKRIDKYLDHVNNIRTNNGKNMNKRIGEQSLTYKYGANRAAKAAKEAPKKWLQKNNAKANNKAASPKKPAAPSK